MAISGPFDRTVISTPYVYKTIRTYRQTPPYMERLAYEMNQRSVVAGSDQPSGASYVALDSSPVYEQALSKAYEKFRNAVSDKAELAVSLAERKQAMDMIVKRLVQFTSFVRCLRKGDLPGVMSSLGFKPPRQTNKRKLTNAEKQKRWEKYRRRARKGYAPVPDTYNEAFDGFSFPSRRALRAFRKEQTGKARRAGEVASDLFLEFHFGWVPLVKDIGAAVDVLQRPFNGKVTVKGKGSARAETGSKPSPGSFSIGRTYVWVSKVQLIADLKIVNPNLYLANKLGLVNPAAVLWEVIPFSFLLDWIANVSSFLAQATEFMGLDLLRPATTHYLLNDVTTWYGWYDVYSTSQVNGVYCRRSPGISKPSLQLKPFRGFSLTRGVTAVSLLLQQMKGIR